MKKLSLLLISFILFTLNVFGEIKLISPVSGTWANKQMLVIENSDNGDYLYSLDGSDPESFGFAYDGPVLIDLTGTVNLNVTCVHKNGEKEKTSLSYTVKADDGAKTSYRDFIKTFYASGMLNYSAGSRLEIPSNLMYSLGLYDDSYIKGQTLTISDKSVLQQNLPCQLWDKEKNVKYRFIIKTYPKTAGTYSRREVPFTVTDWENITFNNKNLIYKIDSNFWELPEDTVKLDRSVSHMISWQSIDYEEGNPVEFFVLPPKPQIKVEINEDGSYIYSINGDSAYTMSVFSKEKNDYLELFTQIGADVFYGDKEQGTLDIGLFADCVYQGKIFTDYKIDKRPPSIPQIKSSAKSFYSRNKVQLTVTEDSDADLYVALSEPFTLPDTQKPYTSESEILQSVQTGEYKKTKNGKYTITWSPKSSGPVYYKIRAYSVKGKNVSESAEYSIIIDQSSYYYDLNADPSLAEGTAEHPFTSFSQCYNELQGVRAVTLRVKGNLVIDQNYILSVNYEFLNEGDAALTFKKDSSFTVKSSTLEINDCKITNENSDSVLPLIKLENSVLTVKNSIFAMNYSSNGALIDSFNSIINIYDSIVSVNALDYAAFISSVKSRISINKSDISVSAQTCLALSLNDGTLKTTNSSFSITGRNGRVAELFGVKAEMSSNQYKAQLSDKNTKHEAVYVNQSAKLTESDNDTYGF